MNPSGFKEDKKLNNEINNRFGIAEELKLDDMIFTLCKGNINKKKYVMKNYSLVDAILWLSLKSRNNEIEKHMMNNDNVSSSKPKPNEIAFPSMEEAVKFLKENKEDV